MNTIYKFYLKLEGEQTIKIQANYEILSVGEQFGDLYLWALVNPDNRLIDKKIFIYGTGHLMEMDITKNSYLGTVITEGGNLVWHIFQ